MGKGTKYVTAFLCMKGGVVDWALSKNKPIAVFLLCPILRLPAMIRGIMVLAVLSLVTAPSSADTLTPLSPEEMKAVVREIKAMVKTDESMAVHFVVREATPERINRLFNMPEVVQLPSEIRMHGLIFAGRGPLLTFDKPSDVINKVSTWFPDEVAAARASERQSFFSHVHLHGPFTNWHDEPAAFLGLWNCMPQMAWLKPQRDPFVRRRGVETNWMGNAAMMGWSNQEHDFGFCLRGRNGRRFANSEEDLGIIRNEIRRTAERITPVLRNKFSRYLSTHRCRGTGPDDCVLILHLWASMSPADVQLAHAIQALEAEIAPDDPLPAAYIPVTHELPVTEEEQIRLDASLRRAAFLRAKLLSILNAPASWTPQALSIVLHQMTLLRQKVLSVMDWRLPEHDIDQNEHLSPWKIVASGVDKYPPLRKAVLAEIEGLTGDKGCALSQYWLKHSGKPLEAIYALQRKREGLPAGCASPDWEWLQKGESAEALALRKGYLNLLARGEADETWLSHLTDNGALCFDRPDSPKPDLQRQVCRKHISEPQRVPLQLPHSRLIMTPAEEFQKTTLQPPQPADAEVAEELGKWLASLLPGLSADAAKEAQSFAEDLQRRNVRIDSATRWSHPRHSRSLLELGLSGDEDPHVDWVVDRQDLTRIEIPQRFRDENNRRAIVQVSDLDDDGRLELWWSEPLRRCQGDESDLERDLFCDTKTLDMGEVQGRVLTYFSNTAKSGRKTPRGAVSRTAAPPVNGSRHDEDQSCNALLIGTLLADELALDFGGESDDGRGDIIDLVCKPHPLHPEQTLVALFHILKDQSGEPSEDKKGFVFALIDFVRKKVLGLYRDTAKEDGMTRIGKSHLRLDTASYNLAPGVRALGVRMAIGQAPSAVDGGESDYLTLFVEEGKQLRPILKNQPMSSWSYIEGSASGHDETRRSIERVERSLSVSAATTNGWRDLELAAHHRVETADPASGISAVQKEWREVVGKFRANQKRELSLHPAATVPAGKEKEN